MSRSTGRSTTPIWVELHWYSPDRGGRSRPPQGPIFSTVARFAGEPFDDAFSVVLRFVPLDGLNGAGHSLAEMNLLFPENFPDMLDRLTPGAELVFHDGPRAVAEGRVVPAPVSAGVSG